MTVYSVGIPVNTHSATGSVTGTWGTSQGRVAGRLLVAVVTCAATTSVTATATSSGWVNQVEQPNTATAQVRAALWTKVAAGGDAAPTFTSTEVGTAGGMDCMLFELSGANTTTPLDTSGVYASGAVAGTVTGTATTGANVTNNAGLAFACFAQQAAAGSLTFTDTGTGGFSALLRGNGVSTVLQTYVGINSPMNGATLNDAGTFSVNTSAFGAGFVYVIAPAALSPAVNWAYANNAAATVTSGGTTNAGGVSGTVESWTVNVTSAFPAASATAQPPVQFTVCDPALPSEKMLVTVAPGGTGAGQSWTVTRGTEGTSPLAHAAGFAVVAVTTAGFLTSVSKELSATAYVDCDYTGTVDASAAFNAALAALPLNFGYPCGTVVFGPGIVKMAVTPNNPGPCVYIQGAGKWATSIRSYITGDCFRVFDPTVYGLRPIAGGGISGLTINGLNAGTTNSSALHIGDILQYQLDIAVSDFIGTGCIGVWFDNEFYWSEQLNGSIYLSHCTQCVVFDNPATASSTSTGSFSRCNLTIYTEQGTDGTGQVYGDGVVLQNGATIVDGSLTIRGNFRNSAAATTAAVLRLAGSTPAGHAITTTTTIGMTHLDIGVENVGAGSFPPMTINTDGTAIINGCYGILDFGANLPFAASNIGFSMGPGFYVIKGDANLGSGGRANVKGSLAYQLGFGSAVVGINQSQGDFFRFILTQNLTFAFNGNALTGPARVTVVLQQAAASSFTVTWPVNGSPTTSSPNIAWAGGVSPQMSTAFNAVDVYVLETYDGAHWFGQAMQASQVPDTEQFTALTGAYTLSNVTTAVPLFNATTNGALTVAALTSYFFECEFDVTALSASAHTLSFGFGGTATYTSVRYRVESNTGAAGTLASWSTAVVNAATATAFTASVTTTTAQALIRGIVRVNAAGTLIPQVTQGTNSAAAIVGVNSWFRLTPVGSNTVTNTGNWS